MAKRARDPNGKLVKRDDRIWTRGFLAGIAEAVRQRSLEGDRLVNALASANIQSEADVRFWADELDAALILRRMFRESGADEGPEG